VHTSLVTLDPPDRIGLGWRIVDVLISVRRSAVGRSLRRAVPLFLLVPAIALVGLLAVGIGLLAWGSLHEYDTFLGLQGSFGFSQYSTVVRDEQFQTDLVRTVAMACITAVVAVLLAIPFSLVLARSRSRALQLALMIVLFVPYLTGDITRTFGWLASLGPHGPLVWICDQLGMTPPNLIGTLWAIGLGTVQVLLPAAVVILLPAVLRLDMELENAASTLGARRYQTFWHITLPQLRVGTFGALAASWALAMGDFADPQILGQGLKDYLANFLQNRYLAIGNPPQGAATGVILIALVTVGAGLILALGRLRLKRRRL
jgi:ABC-type spermidine/putrescine transport system permease subunit I